MSILLRNLKNRKKGIEKLTIFYDQLGFDAFSIGEEEPIMVFAVNDFIY